MKIRAKLFGVIAWGILGLIVILGGLLLAWPDQFVPTLNASAGVLQLQVVSTPTTELIPPNEVGSTTGLVLVAILIVILVFTTILVRWKDWNAEQN